MKTINLLILNLALCIINAAAQNSNPWPNSGSVGIGTTAPATPLHVHGGNTMGGGWNKTFTLSGDFPVQIFNSAETKWAGIGYDRSAALRFWVSGTSENLSTAATMAMSLSNNGNLGIGITTPFSKLDVDGNLRLGSQLDNMVRYVGKGYSSGDITGNNSNWIGFPSTSTQDYLTFGTHLSGVSGGERMRLDAAGNLGIGTTTPASKLEVAGNIRVGNRLQAGTAYIGKSSSGSDLTGGNSNWIGFVSTVSQDYITFGTHLSGVGGGERMRLDAEGNLAIGTTDAAGYKLAVNGNMIAESVKVKLNGSWPDYVFHKNYSLRPLSELEKHLEANKHLPEIPSAEEVSENGINLGEMNVKLLQKIEELTLYLIEKDKQVADLQERMKKVEGRKFKNKK